MDTSGKDSLFLGVHQEFNLVLETAIDEITSLDDSNGGENLVARNMQNQLSDREPDSVISNVPEPLSLADRAEKKRQRQQKRVTLAFFLVSVAFISVAFPVTVTGAIFGLHNIYGVLKIFRRPRYAAMAAIYLRYPYSLIAFIDPFLYGFCNPIVRRKMKKILRKICRCCCKEKQTSNV